MKHELTPVSLDIGYTIKRRFALMICAAPMALAMAVP
jgi:hypothetical protein